MKATDFRHDESEQIEICSGTGKFIVSDNKDNKVENLIKKINNNLIVVNNIINDVADNDEIVRLLCITADATDKLTSLLCDIKAAEIRDNIESF